MEKIGYRAPFVLMTVLGLFFVAHYYVPHPYIQKPGAVMLQWKQPLSSTMLLVACLSLLWMHLTVQKMMREKHPEDMQKIEHEQSNIQADDAKEAEHVH